MDDLSERERAQETPEDLHNAHLPGLVGRMLDDVVRIAEAQTKLFEVDLRAALVSALDRAVGQAAAAILYLAGALCLLGAVIILLRTWLPWWLALAIAGIVIILAGFVVQRIATSNARPDNSSGP